jgi:hypothetical protein
VGAEELVGGADVPGALGLGLVQVHPAETGVQSSHRITCASSTSCAGCPVARAEVNTPQPPRLLPPSPPLLTLLLTFTPSPWGPSAGSRANWAATPAWGLKPMCWNILLLLSRAPGRVCTRRAASGRPCSACCCGTRYIQVGGTAGAWGGGLHSHMPHHTAVMLVLSPIVKPTCTLTHRHLVCVCVCVGGGGCWGAVLLCAQMCRVCGAPPSKQRRWTWALMPFTGHVLLRWTAFWHGWRMGRQVSE